MILTSLERWGRDPIVIAAGAELEGSALTAGLLFVRHGVRRAEVRLKDAESGAHFRAVLPAGALNLEHDSYAVNETLSLLPVGGPDEQSTE